VVLPTDQLQQQQTIQQPEGIAAEGDLNAPPPVSPASVAPVPAPAAVNESQYSPYTEEQAAQSFEPEEQDPLTNLRSSYIDTYSQLYGTNPVFKGDQVQDAAFLTDETQKLEALIQLRNSQNPQEDEHSKYIKMLGQNWKTKQDIKKNMDSSQLTDAKIAPLFWLKDSVVDNATNGFVEIKDDVTGQVLTKDNTMLNSMITMMGGNQQDPKHQNIAANTITTTLAKWLSTDRATEYDLPDEVGSLAQAATGEGKLSIKNKDVTEDQVHTPDDDIKQLAGILNDVIRGARAAETVESGSSSMGYPSNVMEMAQMIYGMSKAMNLKQETMFGNKKVSMRTPLGSRIANSLRYFFQGFAEGGQGRTRSEPTPYGTPGYGTSLDLYRPGNFNRPNEFGTVEIAREFTEAAEIAGNQATRVDESSLILYQLMTKEANKVAKENQLIMDKYSGSGEETLGNVRRELRNSQRGKGGTGLFKVPGLGIQSDEYQVASRGTISSLTYLENNFNHSLNKNRFHTFRVDPSTGRMYDDVIDMNLQRDKIARAVSFANTGPLKVAQGSLKDFFSKNLTRDQIFNNKGTGWWNRLANRIGEKAPVGSVDAEMDFLLTVAMSMDPDLQGKTPWLVLSELTEEKMSEYARIGEEILKGTEALKPLLAKNNLSVVNSDMSLEQMPAGYQEAVKDLMEKYKGSREDLGFKIRAAIDAHNYVTAKRTGTAFRPRSTFAIDMNSAGRSFMASDTGKTDFLKSVGAIFDSQKDLWGHYVDLDSEPRSQFFDLAITKFSDIISDSEKADKLRNLFLDFKNKEGRSFIGSFAKKVLLTTDYGKPSRYHTEEAEQFLYDNPAFANEFMAIMDYKPGTHSQLMFDAVLDLNQIYWRSLDTLMQGSQFQVKGPKNMGKVLAMAGLAPNFKGFFGEDIPFGDYIQVPSGKSLSFSDMNGNNTTVQMFSKKFSAIASASAKTIGKPDYINRKWVVEHFDPGPASKIVNMIGPFLGQYRESLVVAMTILGLNKGKTSEDSLFMYPVFDNFICDSVSLPQAIYYANNIALPKVTGWDLQKPIREAMSNQLAKLDKKLEDFKILGEDKFVIDKYSDYIGTLYMIDKAMFNIEETNEEIRKIEENQSLNNVEKANRKKEYTSRVAKSKAFKEEIEKKIPNYKYVENRHLSEKSTTISGKDMFNLILAYIKYVNLNQDMRAWEEAATQVKPLAQKQIETSGKRGTNVFMM
jgi:hypothetical protein